MTPPAREAMCWLIIHMFNISWRGFTAVIKSSTAVRLLLPGEVLDPAPAQLWRGGREALLTVSGTVSLPPA